MKVIIRSSENSDGALTQRIIVDDKLDLSIYPLYECPEDATLERDMINADNVAAYIKMGFDAAKNGEELEIINEEVKDEEEL